MKFKRARAQSLVEFALLLPVLLVVIFTLIDVAFAFQGLLTVAHASREGMRFAIAYRPNQGECLHRDASGGPIYEPYPDCPMNYAENPTESDNNYFARRSLLIKRTTLEAVRGLRTSTICAGTDSATCVTEHNDDAGMLGVRIWGFQAFDGAEQINMPGLQGLPVRVQVIHNVPLVIFGTFLPNAHIQVNSIASGINEGVQVGFGNLPPPTFGAVPPPVPPGPYPTPTKTPPPGGPTPTPTPIPIYTIELNFETALNELPDDRSHTIVAHVRNASGANVPGVPVTFRTNFGSFSISGVGTPSVIVSTNANGLARTTLYANRPGTSQVTAWLNYNGDGAVDPQEPVDTAVKTWNVTGPYLIVSDHNPAPGAWLGVSVMDHPAVDNPYSLWWCVTSVTSTQVPTSLAFPLNVDVASWDLEDIPIQVPLGVAGRYRIESHRGDGGSNGCNEPSTLVAWSGEIEILDMPPDLVISSVNVTSDTEVRPGEPVTIQITVTNIAPTVATGPTDVDTYMDLSIAPSTMQLGLDKQWVGNLSAFESIVITTTVTVYDFDPHVLWFQVDTTNYVDEGLIGGEDNNIFGPITIQAGCLPLPGRGDDFDGGLGGQWTGLDLPTASHSAVGGRLQIMPNRGRIGGTGTNFDGAHYVHQGPISGNFDIRVQVRSIGSTDDDAEAGLMVRESMDLNSRYFAALVKRNNHFWQDYRTGTGGGATEAGDTGVSLSIYVRIQRSGNTFRSYTCTSATGTTNCTERGSARSITMGPVYVGIFANSDNTGTPGAALFDDFRVSTGSGISSDNFDSGVGGQWGNETLLRGSESAGGGTLAITPGWGDIVGTYDSFRYLHQAPVTGDFSMTVQVLNVLSGDNDANAGLMVRESLSPDAAHYSIFQTRGGNISREYRGSTGANANASTAPGSAPRYLQLARRGNIFSSYYSSDGLNWTLRRTDTLNSLPPSLYIGLATSADNGAVGAATYDNFEICTYDESNLPDPPDPPEINPPGLRQCTELLSVSGFEGNPATVTEYWKSGDTNGLLGAAVRTASQYHGGAFSMRLHASNGFIPCASSHLQPYLYQQITIPTEVYTNSTLDVSGYYYVDKSSLQCSLGSVADVDDVLTLNLYSTSGTPLLTAQPVINGGSASHTWYPISLDLSDTMADPTIYAGQTLRLQWNGYNDTDIDGTFFYLDNMSAQLCTNWDIPPDEGGTASFGGEVRIRGQNNIPILLPGANVWTYAPGGEVLQTRSIHNGTYHFYNVPPGTYVVYAETWMSGQLRTASTQVTVAADERNYNVSLLLQ